ncbi:unnamed protein product [Porites evermanni]|uniref:Uncharacterized protein n=1 Tax=Porites evermanni TaxID=104178 RepID=A0ABN8QPP2_9CNID|nr:unnamed protein product [Porites evermanni]
MAESVLKELLVLIYAPTAVEHILIALGVSIPDLEVEANAPDVNDATGEGEAMQAHLLISFNELVLYDAKDIGQGILASMTVKSVTEFAFKQSNQAVTLATKSLVKIDGNTIRVDLQFLFQRPIPVLADAIWALSMESSDVTVPQRELQFVLDGGGLIHRIPWPQGSTYRNICVLYCNYMYLQCGKLAKLDVSDVFSNQNQKQIPSDDSGI